MEDLNILPMRVWRCSSFIYHRRECIWNTDKQSSKPQWKTTECAHVCLWLGSPLIHFYLWDTGNCLWLFLANTIGILMRNTSPPLLYLTQFNLSLCFAYLLVPFIYYFAWQKISTIVFYSRHQSSEGKHYVSAVWCLVNLSEVVAVVIFCANLILYVDYSKECVTKTITQNQKTESDKSPWLYCKIFISCVIWVIVPITWPNMLRAMSIKHRCKLPAALLGYLVNDVSAVQCI